VSERALALRRLAERVLAKNGDLPLAALLEHAVPAARLRDVARRLGLSPKGGFRLDKAPRHVLAPLLAEQRQPEQLDAVLELLLPERPDDDAKTAEPAPPSAGEPESPLLALRNTEVARLREELERAREGTARALDREAELQRRAQQLAEENVALRGEIDRLRQREPLDAQPRGGGERELQRQVHDLEIERAGFLASDEALRRQLAHDHSRLRRLEATVAELERLVPKGRRRAEPKPPPEPDDRRFRLPRFTPQFHKSLEGKDRRAVERAYQAILLFCTEGHSYPGLEVKQMGGQDTWSLRASLGLRVYFRPLPDGDIELLELADREDQHTTLRRLKDR
jgi:hypothetical protein